MRVRRANAGEMIVETLVSMLVVALSVLMMAGAVQSAARVNSRMKNEDKVFAVNAGALSSSGSVSISYHYQVPGSSGTYTSDVDVTMYQTENGYYYYEKNN